MKLKNYLFSVIFILIQSFQVTAQPNLNSPKLMSSSFPLKKIERIEVHPFVKEKLFALSENQIFLTKDSGKTWEKLFKIGQLKNEVNFLKLHPYKPDSLFLGTAKGLFEYSINKKKMSEIFNSIDKFENNIHAVTFNPYAINEIFIGTKKGLFFSLNFGENWKKLNFLKTKTIFYIRFHPSIKNLLFAQTEEGLFKINLAKNQILKIFNELQVNQEDNKLFKRKFEFSLNNDFLIYLTTQDGFYLSNDFGKTWNQPRFSEMKKGILDFYLSSEGNVVYFLNQKGLYQYNLNETVPIQKIFQEGIFQFSDISFFSGESDHLIFNVYNNLYRVAFQSTPQSRLEKLTEFSRENYIFPDLPDIRIIQQKALEYNHLTTKRMKSWEKRSRLKSFLPNVGFEVERSISNNIDVDRGSTSKPDIFLDGPDDRDFNFSFGVEWELADLIWNDTETAIEIRERALVDQREEVLNEVTRLYFEWKKLKIESLQNQSIEKSLRIEEIKALLDGLTGGFISEHENRN